jgi:hypothetical protein
MNNNMKTDKQMKMSKLAERVKEITKVPQAFPSVVQNDTVLVQGMNLHDWFAGQVLTQALDHIMAPENRHLWNRSDDGKDIYQILAIHAYNMANAMMVQKIKVDKVENDKQTKKD